MKQLLIWVSVFAVSILLIVGLIKLQNKSVDQSGNLTPISLFDQTIGKSDADTVLIEYSDFQCPACRIYAPLIRQLAEEYGDRVLIVYRHYPIRQIHKNAQLAAQASEAAGKQGKFWEMADKIFEQQDAWKDMSNPKLAFEEYAGGLGLDVDKFSKDLESSEVEGKVNSDLESGQAVNVPGTPTFFLNGVMIQNPRSYQEFKSVMEEALNG